MKTSTQKTITLQIDNQQVEVEAGTTILQAARKLGIHIPTLCHSDKVKPQGLCRICLVEINKGGRPKLVASCGYPVEEGLQVRTETPEIIKYRKLLVELLWPSWRGCDKKYNPEAPRFASERNDSECSQCGLCVRYCREVVKKNVVYFKGRGVDRHVAFTPGMREECDSCKQCFKLCTGGWLWNQWAAPEGPIDGPR